MSRTRLPNSNEVGPGPARSIPRTALDELIGCVPYDGPPVSVEEMDAAVEQAVREMWEEFERDCDR
jgi:hypothetical protein